MRIIIQRVRNASVTINEQLHSAIGQGMMILIGIEDADGDDDIAFLVKYHIISVLETVKCLTV